MEKPQWNSELYEQKHSFVWQYGESLIDLLAPQPGESILDLGCGTGHLTAQIANLGCQVWGIDADEQMINQARQTYPHLHFEKGDARFLPVKSLLDAVFSNAVLHWIKEPDLVIERVYHSLKPGGRFVAEFGGKGNIEAIASNLFSTLDVLGYPQENPWYFPSLGQYTTKLEQQGLEVTWAALFSRPTPLEGENGLSNWLRMFAQGILSPLPPEIQQQVIKTVEEKTQQQLYREGCWYADYRRLRLVAYKPLSS